jgi:hypothetical protein
MSEPLWLEDAPAFTIHDRQLRASSHGPFHSKFA